MHRFEQENNMPYVTSNERMAKAEGIDEGRIEGASVCLRLKFGAAGKELANELHSAPPKPEIVQQLLDVIESAQTIEEVRAFIFPAPHPAP